MSLLIDSQYQFESMAREAGLSDPVLNALTAGGISTLSKLAYWVSQPGVPLETRFQTETRNLFGPGLSIGDSASLKRLIFEAQALAVQSLKSMVETLAVTQRRQRKSRQQRERPEC